MAVIAQHFFLGLPRSLSVSNEANRSQTTRDHHYCFRPNEQVISRTLNATAAPSQS